MNWQSLEIEIDYFPISAFEGKSILQSSRELLSESGLPKWCAPHLHFGEFEKSEYLPELRTWTWAQDWIDSYEVANSKYPDAYVLGSAQNNEPIVLLRNNPKVYVFSETGERLLILNTNLENLSKTLFEYAEMVEHAYRLDPKSIEECRISRTSISSFIEKFQSREGHSSASTSTWISWAFEKCKNT